jgi:hypothetical protein
VKGESGPSWSEISRTFHGQSVVIAVSEMQKNAYTNNNAIVPMTAPELSVDFAAVSATLTAASVAAFLAYAGPALVAAATAATQNATRRAAEKTTLATFGNAALWVFSRGGEDGGADVCADATTREETRDARRSREEKTSTRLVPKRLRATFDLRPGKSPEGRGG